MNPSTPYPTVLILDTRDILPIYKNQFEQAWLLSVDFEYIVANIVSAYYYVPKCNARLDEAIDEIQISFEDLKSEMSPMQIDFCMSLTRQMAAELDTYLTTRGFLNYDYFPYRVDTILRDGALVLRILTPQEVALQNFARL